MTSPGPGPRPVAYLVSQYPHISHEFISREVRALRALGVRVQTFSVRPTPVEDVRSTGDRLEHASTTALLARPAGVLTAAAALAARHPMSFARGLRGAVRASHGNPTRLLWQLFYLGEAALLVRRMRADGLRHVHVHFANNGADVARLAVILGSGATGEPWTWSLAMHGPAEFADVVGSDLAEKVRSARFVACISDFCRSQLMALVEPEHWPKLHLVRMTVDTDRYPQRPATGRSEGPLRILFVGRLVPEKGPHQLLEAVQGMPRGAVEVRIVGGGRLAGPLEEQLRRAGLADVVTLTGPLGQDELPAQYGWADVFCLPSFSEGLPVVLMEAMSSGLAVVSTRIAGIPELIEDGVNGVVVPPGRPDLLRHALLDLASHPEERAALGVAAARTVRDVHDPAVNAQALAALLGSGASGSGTSVIDLTREATRTASRTRRG
jgi:colanic acid/amylovoran biosynthesis glycosyltransferase